MAPSSNARLAPASAIIAGGGGGSLGLAPAEQALEGADHLRSDSITASMLPRLARSTPRKSSCALIIALWPSNITSTADERVAGAAQLPGDHAGALGRPEPDRRELVAARHVAHAGERDGLALVLGELARALGGQPLGECLLVGVALLRRHPLPGVARRGLRHRRQIEDAAEEVAAAGERLRGVAAGLRVDAGDAVGRPWRRTRRSGSAPGRRTAARAPARPRRTGKSLLYGGELPGSWRTAIYRGARTKPWRRASRRSGKIAAVNDAGKVAARLLAEQSQPENRSDSNQVRSVPPVRLATSATIFAATASISWSVMVFSRGCSVTAMAIDFLPASMPSPS